MQGKAEEFAKAFHCTLWKICNRLDFSIFLCKSLGSLTHLSTLKLKSVNWSQPIHTYRSVCKDQNSLFCEYVLCIFLNNSKFGMHAIPATFREWEASKRLLKIHFILLRLCKVFWLYCLSLYIFIYLFIHVCIQILHESLQNQEESQRETGDWYINEKLIIYWKKHTCK